MNIISWAEERAGRSKAFHYAAPKLHCVLIGMVVGAFLPAFGHSIWLYS